MACTQAITHRLNLVEYGAVTEIAKNARLVLFTIDQDNVAIFQWFHVVQAVAMGNVCLAVVAKGLAKEHKLPQKTMLKAMARYIRLHHTA